MKKSNYTAITEFEVIAPTNDKEKVGDKYTLDDGAYRNKKGTIEYSLLMLLDHPAHFRVSKLIIKGINYVIPKGRNQNYVPTFHPATYTYIVNTETSNPFYGMQKEVIDDFLENQNME